MSDSFQHSGPYLAAEGETWVLKSDYDALELSHAAAIAQRDRYREAHARLEEQLDALRGAAVAVADEWFNGTTDVYNHEHNMDVKFTTLKHVLYPNSYPAKEHDA